MHASSDISIKTEAVSRTVLGNGLVLLVQPAPPAGLVSITIAIRAGSALEGEYTASGISHFVEHMVFKGTATRKPGAIEEAVKSYGGYINGAVTMDMTTFTMTVPRDRLTEALSLLQDMLTNASFDPQEIEKERAVIENEIKLTNDDPDRRRSRLIFENAYQLHPYRYPPIGYDRPFMALQRLDLVTYYQRMYVPNRMVVAIVGDVDRAAAVASAELVFAKLRASAYSTAIDTAIIEPPQYTPRAVAEERPLSLAYAALNFPSVSLHSPDLYALDVLAIILGRGETSRLTTAVCTRKKLVHMIDAWNYTPYDRGIFAITFIADPVNTDEAILAITEEIARVRNQQVAADELAAAKRTVLSDFVFSHESQEGQADTLAMDELLAGNYRFSSYYVDGVQAVTAADIQRVAGEYLRPDAVTAVRLVPPGAGTPSTAAAPMRATGWISKTVLPNGLTLLIHENKRLPIISLTCAVRGGLLAETAQTNGISNLVAELLTKGTATRTAQDIQRTIEYRGGTLESFSGFNSFGITVTALAPDVDIVLDLVADIMTSSVFPQDEIDHQKSLIYAAIKEEDDNIFAYGAQALRTALFEHHPYGRRMLGTPASVSTLTRDDLLRFYAAHTAPAGVVIAISGDIDHDAIVSKMTALFGNRPGGSVWPWPTPPVPQRTTAGHVREKLDREEAMIALGFIAVPVTSPDRYVFDVISSILSGSSGRLFRDVRNTQSLAYALGTIPKYGIDTGYFLAYAATPPDKISHTRRGIEKAISSLRVQRIGDEELRSAKAELISQQRMQMQTNSFYALQCALDELYGIGYNAPYDYAAHISAVTSDDILRVANTYLKPDQCVDSTITP